MDEKKRQEVIAELDAKHNGRVEAYELENGTLIVIAPPQRADVEYKRFLDGTVAKDESTAQAQEDFARACVVHPTNPDEVSQLFKKYPAIASDLAKDAATLLEGRMKKLGKVSKTPNAKT